MAHAGSAGQKGGPTGEHRTADEPGQTLNVDLCFVPARHAVAAHLPAVSGSSGRLVIYGPRPDAEDAARTWPGQVFDDPETAYATAMRAFVRRSPPEHDAGAGPPAAQAGGRGLARGLPRAAGATAS